MAAVFSGLSQTRALACTEVGNGPWLATFPAPLRYATARIVHLHQHPADHVPQLFGGSAAAKQYLYKLEDYNKASWGQNFVASIAGSSASIIVSAPLDVIKTRIQNRNFENPESGLRIVANMAKNEGASSFFKGLIPKLLMTGPKLTFSFWLAQTLIPLFSGFM